MWLINKRHFNASYLFFFEKQIILQFNKIEKNNEPIVEVQLESFVRLVDENPIELNRHFHRVRLLNERYLMLMFYLLLEKKDR